MLPSNQKPSFFRLDEVEVCTVTFRCSGRWSFYLATNNMIDLAAEEEAVTPWPCGVQKQEARNVDFCGKPF